MKKMIEGTVRFELMDEKNIAILLTHNMVYLELYSELLNWSDKKVKITIEELEE